MTTLIQQNGQYVVKPGDNLSRIASTQGRTLQELLATNPQFASNPNLIRPGQVVNMAPTNNNSGFTLPNNTPSNVSPQITSFTEALVKILKDAQGRNQTGQAALMAQSNQITGQGVQDAGRIFNDANFDPSSGTSLGSSAMNAYDPQQNSIADQQKLANANLGNITDLVNLSQDAYDKEQNRHQQELDRIQSAKEHAQTLAAGRKLTAGETYDQTLASFDPSFSSTNKLPNGNPIIDTNGYMTPEAWKIAISGASRKTISRDDFIKKYANYLYGADLASYGLTGVEQAYVTKPASASSAETEAIINAILNK